MARGANRCPWPSRSPNGPAQWVNQQVNTSIKAKTDKDRWGIEDIRDFAEDGYGDCEDYQLVKRKRLVDAGFPRRAPRMTVMNITKAHFAEVNDKIGRLTALRDELETMVACDKPVERKPGKDGKPPC